MTESKNPCLRRGRRAPKSEVRMKVGEGNGEEHDNEKPVETCNQHGDAIASDSISGDITKPCLVCLYV